MTTTLPADPTTTPELAAPAPAAPIVAPTPILGLLGLLCALSGIAFGLVIPLSIVAIVLGWLALSREPQQRTLAIWAIVLGAVPGALAVLAGVVAATVLVPFGLAAAFFG